MKQRTLNLEVQETYVRDYGRSIARIDPESMQYLGVSAADALEIRPALPKTKENAATVAKCMPLYPSDDGKGIVRVSELVRKNAGDVVIGDNVVLKKIKTVIAKSVTLYQVEPTRPTPLDGFSVCGLDTMPVMKGGMIAVPTHEGTTWFRVLDVDPEKVVTITRSTVFELKNTINDSTTNIVKFPTLTLEWT